MGPQKQSTKAKVLWDRLNPVFLCTLFIRCVNTEYMIVCVDGCRVQVKRFCMLYALAVTTGNGDSDGNDTGAPSAASAFSRHKFVDDDKMQQRTWAYVSVTACMDSVKVGVYRHGAAFDKFHCASRTK